MPGAFLIAFGAMKQSKVLSILHGRSHVSASDRSRQFFWSNYMFNNTLKILFAVSFMVLGSFTAANAQLGNGNAIRVTVDHPFVVEDKTFPAGKYTIATIGDFDGSDSILKLQSLNGKEFVAFQTIGEELNEPAKSTELIFDRIGDEYILSKIRIAGDIEGTEVEKTRSEKAALAAAAVN